MAGELGAALRDGRRRMRGPAGEQLWFSARGKLVFFYEGLDANEKLSHGSDDGAFAGLSAIAQALNAGGDDGVAGGCGMGSHAEAFSDFGPTANDRAPDGELAAVPVE